MTSKNDQEDDDDDDDEEEITIKKEPSPNFKGLFFSFKNSCVTCLHFMTYSNLTGNLSVKVEAKNIDQKPNTPRSKHSATEQRRRSKINDRHASQPSRFKVQELYALCLEYITDYYLNIVKLEFNYQKNCHIST